MNENKRMIILFGGIVGIIVVILLLSMWPQNDSSFQCKIKADKKFNKLGVVNYTQYQCLSKSKTKIPLVIKDKLDNKSKDTLNNIAKQIHKPIYYIDIANIEKSELKTIKKDLKQENESTKGIIMVLTNGKVDSSKEGILNNKDKLMEFAKKNNLEQFACNIKADKEYKNLGDINYEQYQCLTKSDEPFAVIIAQTTCHYCLEFKPIIDKYVEDNNLTIYIIEIDQWKNADKEAFTSSLDYFKKNENWGTPLTLGIKNKKVIAEINGFTDDKEAISGFFRKAGLK